MNKIRWLIVFSVLVFISLPVSADDTVIWNNPKTINHAKLNMTAPQEFNTCIISPDGAGGWDTCTAFIIVGNNFQHLPSGLISFNSFWRKGNVRNVQYQYTKTWYDSVIIDNDSTTPIKVFSGFTSSIPSVNIGEYFAVKMTFEKRSYTSDFFDFTAQAGSDSITLDPDVSACGTLNTVDAVYTLTQNIQNDAGSCLVVSANGITIDGNGFWINASVNGINSITGSDNWIVKNAFFNSTTTSSKSLNVDTSIGNNITIYNNTIETNGSGIVLTFTTNSNISNNIINIRNIGGSGNGISVFANSNNNIFINNTVIKSGSTNTAISGSSGTNNTFINGSIYSTGSATTYSIGNSVVYFINTNFTTRTFSASITNSLNYSNDSIVFVSTNASTSKTIMRTLFNWNQTNITVRDNVTVTTGTSNYSVSGLITNRHYRVYNNSILNFTLITDSSGILQPFTMNLTTSPLNVSVLANNPPVITGIGSSYTIDIGQPLTITPTITDADGDSLTNITNATLGSFDSSTGVLSFTPLNTQSGVYSWNITAVDSVGDSTTADFTVLVNTPYKTACNNAGNDTNVAFGLVGVLLIITSAFGIIATIRGQNMVLLISFIGVGILGSVLLVIGIFITSTISNGLC